MALNCFLFGHRGNLTESGHHLCDRCWQHAYWDSQSVREANQIDIQELPYEYSGVLFWPFFTAKRFFTTQYRNIISWWWVSVRGELPF